MKYLLFTNITNFNLWAATINTYFGYPKKNMDAETLVVDTIAVGTDTYTTPVTKAASSAIVAVVEDNCPAQFITGQNEVTYNSLIADGWFPSPY